MAEEVSTAKIAQNTAWYFFALVAQKAISFLYFSYLARKIGVSSTGVYTLVLPYAAVFGVLIDFGISQVLIRELSQDFSKIKELGSTLLVFKFLSGIVAIGAALIFAPHFGVGEHRNLVTLGMLIVFLDSFTLFFYSIMRASQNLKYESIGIIAFQIILTGVGLGFLLTGHLELEKLILAIIAASMFGLVYSFITVLRKTDFRIRFKFDSVGLRKMLKPALFFFATGAMIKVYNAQDAIIITKFTNSYTWGLYSLPSKVMFTWPFLAMAFSGSMYPALSHYFSRDKVKFKRLFLSYLGIMLSVSVPLSLGLYFGAEFLLSNIWPAFIGSLKVWKYLALGLPLLFVEFPLGAVLNASHHEKWNSINRAVHVLLAVVLNLALVPVYGLNGALISFFAANIALVGLGLYKSLKITRLD